MTPSRQPQLLDLVAVLKNPPNAIVEVGDVGTVVELLPPDGREVEFLDRNGQIRCLITLSVLARWQRHTNLDLSPWRDGLLLRDNGKPGSRSRQHRNCRAQTTRTAAPPGCLDPRQST